MHFSSDMDPSLFMAYFKSDYVSDKNAANHEGKLALIDFLGNVLEKAYDYEEWLQKHQFDLAQVQEISPTQSISEELAYYKNQPLAKSSLFKTADSAWQRYAFFGGASKRSLQPCLDAFLTTYDADAFYNKVMTILKPKHR